jgi:hypothetical protein
MMLARQAAPDAMRRLIELMRSEDERVASVACNAVLERAWGKPKLYDPADEPKPKRRFDPSKYTLKELEQIQAALVHNRLGVAPSTVGSPIEAVSQRRARRSQDR